MPTSQYLLPFAGGKLQATWATTLLPQGKLSILSRIPGFSERGNRTPQPSGLTSSV
jgi:hypothetical protein